MPEPRGGGRCEGQPPENVQSLLLQRRREARASDQHRPARVRPRRWAVRSPGAVFAAATCGHWRAFGGHGGYRRGSEARSDLNLTFIKNILAPGWRTEDRSKKRNRPNQKGTQLPRWHDGDRTSSCKKVTRSRRVHLAGVGVRVWMDRQGFALGESVDTGGSPNRSQGGLVPEEHCPARAGRRVGLEGPEPHDLQATADPREACRRSLTTFGAASSSPSPE